MRSAVVIACIALLAGCNKQRTEAVAPTLYDAAAVEKRDIKVTVDAAGIIEPESIVEVKSQASGEVLNVHAEIGDVVEAKKLLIEIDKRTPRNKVADSEASLAAAKARRTIAKTQLDRAEALHKTQTLTQADVEKAQLEFAQADAQVVTATINLENARITLEDTDVRAPAAGTILEKNVERGTVIASSTSNVSGGAVLMKMADLTEVQVRTRVDETDIGKIKPGMLTKVTVAAYPNQPFEGTVLKIEPQAIVEQNVTMFAVLIKLPNPGGVLKPGMNADVQIQISERSSVAAVPTAALRADSDIELTAKMLGMDEGALRRQIWPDGEPTKKNMDGKATFKLPNGREVPLPEGMDAAKVTALMEKRRGGGELSADEQKLLRQVFQNAGGGGNGGGGFARNGGGGGGNGGGGFGGGGGGFGGGGPPGGFGGGGGGGFPGGGFPGGGARGGQGGQGGQGAAAASRSTEYLFSGDYWVIALRNDQPVPLAVKTGLTDLDYSEVVSGLEPGDKVLLLPSASLYEQQERLQQFITQRFSSSTPFQQGGGNNGNFNPRNFR